MPRRNRPYSYRQAVSWIARNDDVEWVKDDPDAPLSVTAGLVADIYDRTDVEVRRDLLKEMGHI